MSNYSCMIQCLLEICQFPVVWIPEGSTMPRIHPIIQTVSLEWKTAGIQNYPPRWGLFTEKYIMTFCSQVEVENLGWHEDLYATDLTHYLACLPESRCWWHPKPPQPGSTTSASTAGASAGAGPATGSSTLPTVHVSAASPLKVHLIFTAGGVSRMGLYFHSCIFTYPIGDVWPVYPQGNATLCCTTWWDWTPQDSMPILCRHEEGLQPTSILGTTHHSGCQSP